MKIKRLLFRLFGSALLLTGSLGAINTASAAVCLPDCDNTGVRSLVVAGVGLSSFAGQPVNVSFSSSSTNANFMYSIFDGETGGFWDLGSGALTDLKYTLKADPRADCSGSGGVLNTRLGSTMTDNDWSGVTILNSPAAQSGPGGDYFYCLTIEPNIPPQTGDPQFESSFKVRTTLPNTSLALRPQNFGVVSPLRNFANPTFTNWDLTRELPVIYPGPDGIPNNGDGIESQPFGGPVAEAWLSDPVNTIYDGSWTLYFLVNQASPYVGTWNGDFDYGNDLDCGGESPPPDPDDCDDDDPDTADTAPPPWAAGEMVEGLLDANPLDNSPFALFRRLTLSGLPIITLNVDNGVDPPFAFNNPSGDEEWEQGMITTDPTINPYPELPTVPNTADHTVGLPGDTLPLGNWAFNIDGLDLSNLNGVRFFHCVLGVDENGNPVDTPVPCPTPGSCPAVDFNQDAFGNPLAAGTEINEQYASLGIHISVKSNGNHNVGMVFDTNNPTGGDFDLGSPNQGCNNPGPGVGAGGLPSNCINENGALLTGELGNVLIISEDNNSSDPDDERFGGVVIFNFDDPRQIDDVRLLDMDGCRGNASITVFDAVGIAQDPAVPLKTVSISSFGNNEVQDIAVDAQNVRRLVVDFPCSGAVAELCPDDEPEDPCDPGNSNTNENNNSNQCGNSNTNSNNNSNSNSNSNNNTNRNSNSNSNSNNNTNRNSNTNTNSNNNANSNSNSSHSHWHTHNGSWHKHSHRLNTGHH